jgi:hypothetical protein
LVRDRSRTGGDDRATVSGGAICPGASTTITAALTGTAPFSVTWSDNVTQTTPIDVQY